MKALRLTAHGTPGQFEVAELAVPTPGPTEVLVKVEACGLNHLDLWVEEKGLPIPITLPLIQGSEAAGTVAAIGDRVHDRKVGDRVCISSGLSCGECEFCLREQDSMCTDSLLFGVQCNGGFSEFALAPSRHAVPLPDGLSFDTAAAVTLAASTAMHMLTSRTSTRAGDWVLVIGAGSGVGSAAIQIAKQLGARVIATGSSEPKRQLATQLGADFVVDSTSENWSREVRRITAKRGVDTVIEHVGGETLQKAFDCLARGGTIVTCGATAGREIALNLWPLFVKQQRLIGSYSRDRIDLVRTLEWAAEGRIKPVIDRIVPLAQGAAAFGALRRREVLGKVLIHPACRTYPDRDSESGSG
ncbi:MAG: zinc-binding dehydrogenase [Verrucomicrobiales bacterium]|nr:zinc-binding dehydrogenase [Verrucomicrobiales bacterium]